MKTETENRCVILLSTDTETLEELETILPADQYVLHPMTTETALLSAAVQSDIILIDPEFRDIEIKAISQHLKKNARTRHLPIVLIVDEEHLEQRIEGLEWGADDLLLKPFHNREVVARIAAQRRTKALHDQVLKHQGTQRALFQLSTLTNPLLPPEKILTELCQKTAELTGMSLVLITTGDAASWHVNAAYRSDEDAPNSVVEKLGDRVWEVLEAREAVCHDDGPGPYLGVPLQGPDNSIQGVLHGFGGAIVRAQDRLELLSIVGQRIGSELHMQEYNQRLRQEVDIRTQELQNALQDLSTANRKLLQAAEDTMRRLAMAANYRDADTGAHIDRMAEFAQAIAKELGWSKEEQQLIYLAAPMHDIGKIGIPDSILQKSGHLTPDEWEHMKDHPTIGARILAGSTSRLLQMAEVIALHHHERYDGEGYPNGLRNEEIPLAGRIVALADVFDAMTTSRCYKEAWSMEQALRDIREESGKHFDPRVVDAFFRALPKIIEIYNKGRDIPITLETKKEFAA